MIQMKVCELGHDDSQRDATDDVRRVMTPRMDKAGGRNDDRGDSKRLHYATESAL